MRDKWIEACHRVGRGILYGDIDTSEVINRSSRDNPWFTEKEVRRALVNIASEFLNEEKLRSWLRDLPETENSRSKKVGLILAGNIPAVGFHDCLCVLMSSHDLLIKLSAKDRHLIPFLLNAIEEQVPESGVSKTHYVDRLTDYDAVIATGSDQSYKVFKSYFSEVPHIIRGHRNAVGIINGNENSDSLIGLGHDVFDFYGLGCRNISKIYTPVGYDWKPLLQLWEEHFIHVIDNHKYRHNYDYNLALFLLNKSSHLLSQNLILVRSSDLFSRLASLHYEEYSEEKEIAFDLKDQLDKIQCIVSDRSIEGVNTIQPGEAQKPGLTDYADNIDVMSFLQSI